MPVIAALVLAAALGAEPVVAVPEAPGPSFGFDRVDLVSEDPGTWLNYDVPLARANGLATAIRFVTQIKPVFRLPVDHLYVGLSLTSQSLVYERPFSAGTGLSWSLGLQTKYLLPAGAFAGLSYRVSYLRLGVGVSAVSSASWSHLSWKHWNVLPTVGIGVGRAFQGP